MEKVDKKNEWALILGGSGGLGLASAKKLAKNGYHLLLVHRDRRGSMDELAKVFDELRSYGNIVETFNIDATKAEKRKEVIDAIKKLEQGNLQIKVLLHSIAKGNLKPILEDREARLTASDFSQTIDSMAISWYEWTMDLLDAGLFVADSRVLAFTSEGNAKAIPLYAAVSAAKSTLESLCRNMAVALAPKGIRVNCIQAGVTDTASLRMIPGYEQIISMARKRNPFGRLTSPEEVADAVYLMCREEASWITGTIIKVDGGESLR